jgi:hypothetical protein
VKYLPQIVQENAKVRVPAKRTLEGNALDLYREENDELRKQVTALTARVLSHDKKEAEWLRSVRSATEDAEAYLEAVSILAAGISNTRREGRSLRLKARRLLASRGAFIPATLGSPRQRAKKSRSQKTLT